MIAISVNDLTLRFGTTTILEKVSFSLEENDKLGIIGSNGSGKTSLFKLITGEYDAENRVMYFDMTTAEESNYRNNLPNAE